MSNEASRKQAQAQWNTTPCGVVEGVDDTTLAYFEAVERARYTSDDWILCVVPFHQAAGKKVLEIGCGQGTDLVQFAKAGGDCTGIDITERHMALARKNFALRGLPANIIKMDATKLDFPDDSFDIVYSCGVIHHISDGEKVFAEAYRVLKPGGRFFVALFYKWSVFHLFSKILSEGFRHGKLFSIGYDGFLSTIESGADGVDIKPYVKLYSKKELVQQIGARNFFIQRVVCKHLKVEHYGIFRRFLPERFCVTPWLEKRFGWYICVDAKKD